MPTAGFTDDSMAQGQRGEPELMAVALWEPFLPAPRAAVGSLLTHSALTSLVNRACSEAPERRARGRVVPRGQLEGHPRGRLSGSPRVEC